MLTQQDLQNIKTIIKEELNGSENRLREEVTNSEQRLKKEVESSEQRLSEKTEATEKRIISEVGKFIADVILPQIDDKADKKDVERLEGKLDRLLHAN